MPKRDADQAVWAGRDYAEQAHHHRQFDDWFLDRHPPESDEVVVDAGCGSGEFTARLARLVPEGRVVGVDPDPSMLQAAERHDAPNLQFRQGRLQDLDAVCPPATADLVVSRAVFHWIPLADYLRCYEAILAVLRPGGWLHTESGGAGNLRRMGSLLDDVGEGLGLEPADVSFPDAGTAFDLLEQAGFRIPESGVTTVAQRRPFERDQLVGMVRTQASPAYVSEAPDDVRERFLSRAEDRLDELERHDGSYDQTLVRLHVLCQHPKTEKFGD